MNAEREYRRAHRPPCKASASVQARAPMTGKDTVTVNVIRQWVAWDVLPKASAQGQVVGTGPAWSRSRTGMRRATRLAELRKRGVKRENALIVQAHIEWGYRDLDRLRDALTSEWAKWSKQLIRRRTTRIGNHKFEDLSAVQRRAIRAQLGSLDSRFIDSQFQQPDEFYAVLAEFAETGESRAQGERELVGNAIERILPGLGQLRSEAQINGIIASLAGAIGSPDEISNSAHSEIENASDRELRMAGAFLRRHWRKLRQTDLVGISVAKPISELQEKLNSVFPEISIGAWAATQLVQCLLLIRRGQRCSDMSFDPDDFGHFLATSPPFFAISKA